MILGPAPSVSQLGTLSARRTAHCPHAAQHIVRTPHSTLSARRTAHCPHAAQHIGRTPAWSLRHTGRAALYRGIAFNSLRHGRCGTQGGRPYTEESPSIDSGMAAAAHRADGLIQRNRLQFTPAWPPRHTGRAGYGSILLTSRPYTEESPSIHSGMVAAAHRADGLIQRNRLQFTPAWPLRHTGRTALYRGIAFNSLRHGRCGTHGGRATDLFCRLACDRRPSGQRMLVKHGDFALLMLPGRNGSQ